MWDQTAAMNDSMSSNFHSLYQIIKKKCMAEIEELEADILKVENEFQQSKSKEAQQLTKSLDIMHHMLTKQTKILWMTVCSGLFLKVPLRAK